MTNQAFHSSTFRKFAAVCAIAVGVLAVRSANAQLLAYEGFAYDNGSNLTNASALTGGFSGVGGDSFGWASRWYGANNPIATNQAGSLGYTDLAGNALVTDGGSVVIGTPAGTTLTSQPSRSFNFGTLNAAGTTYSGLTNTATTYWASYTMQWIGPQTFGSTTNLYVRKGDIAFRTGSLTNATGTGTETLDVGSPNAANRIGTPLDTWSLWRGPDASAGTLNTGLATTSVPLTNSTFVLLRLDLDGTSASDTAYMWLNWTNLSVVPDIAFASATNTSGNIDGLNNIRLDANGGNATGTNTVMVFDEFRLGSSYGSVTPFIALAPEPGSATLVLGAVAFATIYRRRKASK